MPPSSRDAEAASGSGVAARIVLAVVVVLAASALFLLGEEVPDPVVRGAEAPGFDLPRLAIEPGAPDTRMTLASLRGRPVLVNFWATWCKPCEDEMPAMERLYRALGPRGFELVAISVDEGREEVAAFRSKMALSFPILLDPAQESARRYQTTGFPESFLVDPQGVVIERYVGPREWDHPDHVARIERLLEGGAGS